MALFQSAATKENPTPLIGIEEPESALHPAAAGVLRDALRAASQHTQVLVTSHSPELLDDKYIQAESILSVLIDNGVTTIAPLDEAGRTTIQEGLYTPGELLRLNQLEPEPEQIVKQQNGQLDLFAKYTQ